MFEMILVAAYGYRELTIYVSNSAIYTIIKHLRRNREDRSRYSA